MARYGPCSIPKLQQLDLPELPCDPVWPDQRPLSQQLSLLSVPPLHLRSGAKNNTRRQKGSKTDLLGLSPSMAILLCAQALAQPLKNKQEAGNKTDLLGLIPDFLSLNLSYWKGRS